RLKAVGEFIDRDPLRISWSTSLISKAAQDKTIQFDRSLIVSGNYRPFNRQAVYFSADLNHRTGQLPRMFPTPRHENLGFYITGTGSEEPFSALMIEGIPDLHAVGTKSVGPHFPRYTYRDTTEEGTLFAGANTDAGGFERVDNISDAA